MRCYPYECADCGNKTEVYKNLSDIERPEHCTCGSLMERKIASRQNFFGEAEWNSEQYQKINPGLGCRVKSKAHKKEVCKRLGCVEVGNDFKDGASMQKYDDTRREAELAKRYDDII